MAEERNEFIDRRDEYTRWIADRIITKGFSEISSCVHGIMMTERSTARDRERVLEGKIKKLETQLAARRARTQPRRLGPKR